MDTNYPKVSVIIPTFEREEQFLLRAIKSVCNQTYTNIEIIIVDDNHKDSIYRKKAEELVKKLFDYNQIIYHTNEKNLGGALARNIGINLSTGSFITFLDDDDEYMPKKIENQLNFMMMEDCDLSFTDLRLVNEKKELVDYREFSRIKSFDNQYLKKYHLMRHLTGTPTFMFKANKIREIGGFENVNCGQEFYLMMKAIESDLVIRYYNNCDVLAFRHSNGGISYGENKIRGEKELYKYKKQHFELFNKKEKRFIKFRHYAVMCIAYKRNREYVKSFGSGVIMFVSSPMDCGIELKRYCINVLRKRK